MAERKVEYKVGARLSVVVPAEPPPRSAVVDEDDEIVWQRQPDSPGGAESWNSSTGKRSTWEGLVTTRTLKVIYLPAARAQTRPSNDDE